MIAKTELVSKIKAMSAKEIILTMVGSLRDPTTYIDTGTYGHIENGICFGCVATNTIIKIAELSEKEAFKILSHTDVSGFSRATFKDGIGDLESIHFIDCFEMAINNLRQTDIDGYNDFAESVGIQKIKNVPWSKDLPYLTDYYTEEDLKMYEKLAEAQT